MQLPCVTPMKCIIHFTSIETDNHSLQVDGYLVRHSLAYVSKTAHYLQ